MYSPDLYTFTDIGLIKNNIQLNKLLKSLPDRVIRDVFPYRLAPSDKMTIDEYYETLRQSPREYYKLDDNEVLEDWMKSDKSSDPDEKLPVTKLYCIIDYPLSYTAYVKFDVPDLNTLTTGIALHAYTNAYQRVYDMEDDDVGAPTPNIPGMLNRDKSNGRFGIWGHSINDLVYNGSSEIKLYGRIAVCQFRVDS